MTVAVLSLVVKGALSALESLITQSTGGRRTKDFLYENSLDAVQSYVSRLGLEVRLSPVTASKWCSVLESILPPRIMLATGHPCVCCAVPCCMSL